MMAPRVIRAGRQNVDKDVRISVQQGEELLAMEVLVRKLHFLDYPLEVKENRVLRWRPDADLRG